MDPVIDNLDLYWSGFLRSLGAEPLTYGEGLAERLREAAPDGLDAGEQLRAIRARVEPMMERQAAVFNR